MISLQDRKAFSGKRASEGLSSNFKTISRDKQASWGNRFIRDHNDLIYDADVNSISNRLKKSAKPRIEPAQNQEENAEIKKYQYSPVKQRQLARSSQSQRNIKKGLNLDNYMPSLQHIQSAKKIYQETAATTSRKTRFIDHKDNTQVTPFNDYGNANPKPKGPRRNFIQQNIQEVAEYEIPQRQEQVNLLGLSKYEYEGTIHGKLITKSNHHLDFSRNKTNKIDNVIRPWYDHSKDIQKSLDIADKEKGQSLQRMHSFKSYSPHRLFHRTKRMYDDNGCGNGGMLDQYYEVADSQKYDVNHFRTARDIVDYPAMTARPELPKKLGTNLEYKVQEAKTMGVGNRKRPIMELSHSPRRLVFTRQVISPTRGCFR